MSSVISNSNSTLSEKDRRVLESQAKDEPYSRSFVFFKSPEGVAEYEKLGMPYPRTMPDDWYDRFLKITARTKKEDHKQYIGQVKLRL
jgi:hypothetical protein